MFSTEHDREEDLSVVCECTRCLSCDGEGCKQDLDDLSKSVPCPRCHGTGINSDDCAVHYDINGESYPNGVCCPGWARHQRHSRTCGNYLSNVADENDTDPEVAA